MGEGLPPNPSPILFLINCCGRPLPQGERAREAPAAFAATAGSRMIPRPRRDLGVSREPDIAQCLCVTDQFLDDPDARAIADHVRMHGELEDAAIGMRRV